MFFTVRNKVFFENQTAKIIFLVHNNTKARQFLVK